MLSEVRSRTMSGMARAEPSERLLFVRSVWTGTDRGRPRRRSLVVFLSTDRADLHRIRSIHMEQEFHKNVNTKFIIFTISPGYCSAVPVRSCAAADRPEPDRESVRRCSRWITRVNAKRIVADKVATPSVFVCRASSETPAKGIIELSRPSVNATIGMRHSSTRCTAANSSCE
jgi:hypothetical protein